MLTTKQKEELIHMINQGIEVDLELLALELDISEEEIQKIQEEARQRMKSQEETNSEPGKVSKRKKNRFKKKDISETEEKVEIEIPEEEDEEIERPDYEETIRNLKQTIEANQKKNKSVDMNKRNVLARTYYLSGRFEEAREELEKIITEYQSPVAYQQMITLERENGNSEDARYWAYEALEQHQKNPNIMKQLIALEAEDGDLNEAVNIAKQLVELDPRRKDYQAVLVRVQKRKEEIEKKEEQEER